MRLHPSSIPTLSASPSVPPTLDFGISRQIVNFLTLTSRRAKLRLPTMENRVRIRHLTACLTIEPIITRTSAVLHSIHWYIFVDFPPML